MVFDPDAMAPELLVPMGFDEDVAVLPPYRALADGELLAHAVRETASAASAATARPFLRMRHLLRVSVS